MSIFEELSNVELDVVSVDEGKAYKPSPVINKPGVYKLYLTGLNEKFTQFFSPTRLQVAFNFETSKVNHSEFKPTDSSVMGGQVATIKVGIPFNPKDGEHKLTKGFYTSLRNISIEAGKQKEFDSLREGKHTLDVFFNKFVELLKDVELQYAVGGKEYCKDSEGTVYLQWGFQMQRFNFVSSLDKDAPELNEEYSLESMSKQIENGLESYSPKQYELYQRYLAQETAKKEESETEISDDAEISDDDLSKILG